MNYSGRQATREGAVGTILHVNSSYAHTRQCVNVLGECVRKLNFIRKTHFFYCVSYAYATPAMKSVFINPSFKA